MTREEAIKHFEAQAQCNYRPFSEVAKMAVFALRAQQTPLNRSRWEGCDWCNSLEKNNEDFKCGDLCAISGVEYTFWGDGAKYIKDESFCPLCGKPLTEEAWAELERRINNEPIGLLD